MHGQKKSEGAVRSKAAMSLIAPPVVFCMASPRLQSLLHWAQDRGSVCVGVSVWCSSGVQPGCMCLDRTDVCCC